MTARPIAERCPPKVDDALTDVLFVRHEGCEPQILVEGIRRGLLCPFRYLGVPERVVAKPPSAGLWADQTDEAEMGLTYEELDAYLLTSEASPAVMPPEHPAPPFQAG